MRSRVNRLLARRIARSALAGALLSALPASAQESEPSLFADTRWIPSLAIISGVTAGGQHATVSSDCRVPGSDPPVPTSCSPENPNYGSVPRPGDADDELSATPYVGGSLALEAPAFAAPGRPRLFASVELPYQFGIDRNVAQHERPTGLVEPEVPPSNPNEKLDESALLGAGARTRSEIEGLAYGASAGVVFSFDAFGRQFHVKPFAQYLRTQIDLRGRIEAGICNHAAGGQGQQTCDLDGKQPPGVTDAFTRVVTLKAHENQWFDWVGPGLELEMETGRFGPYTVSLFLSGGGYYLFGSRDMALSTTRTIGPDKLGAAVDYHADFTFRVAPWLYRGGLGLRFSWVGYD